MSSSLGNLIPIQGGGKKDDKKQKGGGYDLTGGLIDIGGSKNNTNSQRPSSSDFDLDIDDLLSDKPSTSSKKKSSNSSSSSSKSSSKDKDKKSKSSSSSSSPKKKSKSSSSSSSKKKKKNLDFETSNDSVIDISQDDLKNSSDEYGINSEKNKSSTNKFDFLSSNDTNTKKKTGSSTKNVDEELAKMLGFEDDFGGTNGDKGKYKDDEERVANDDDILNNLLSSGTSFSRRRMSDSMPGVSRPITSSSSKLPSLDENAEEKSPPKSTKTKEDTTRPTATATVKSDETINTKASSSSSFFSEETKTSSYNPSFGGGGGGVEGSYDDMGRIDSTSSRRRSGRSRTSTGDDDFLNDLLRPSSSAGASNKEKRVSWLADPFEKKSSDPVSSSNEEQHLVSHTDRMKAKELDTDEKKRPMTPSSLENLFSGGEASKKRMSENFESSSTSTSRSTKSAVPVMPATLLTTSTDSSAPVVVVSSKSSALSDFAKTQEDLLSELFPTTKQPSKPKDKSLNPSSPPSSPGRRGFYTNGSQSPKKPQQEESRDTKASKASASSSVPNTDTTSATSPSTEEQADGNGSQGILLTNPRRQSRSNSLSPTKEEMSESTNGDRHISLASSVASLSVSLDESMNNSTSSRPSSPTERRATTAEKGKIRRISREEETVIYKTKEHLELTKDELLHELATTPPIKVQPQQPQQPQQPHQPQQPQQPHQPQQPQQPQPKQVQVQSAESKKEKTQPVVLVDNIDSQPSNANATSSLQQPFPTNQVSTTPMPAANLASLMAVEEEKRIFLQSQVEFYQKQYESSQNHLNLVQTKYDELQLYHMKLQVEHETLQEAHTKLEQKHMDQEIKAKQVQDECFEEKQQFFIKQQQNQLDTLSSLSKQVRQAIGSFQCLFTHFQTQQDEEQLKKEFEQETRLRMLVNVEGSSKVFAKQTQEECLRLQTLVINMEQLLSHLRGSHVEEKERLRLEQNRMDFLTNQFQEMQKLQFDNFQKKQDDISLQMQKMMYQMTKHHDRLSFFTNQKQEESVHQFTQEKENFMILQQDFFHFQQCEKKNLQLEQDAIAKEKRQIKEMYQGLQQRQELLRQEENDLRTRQEEFVTQQVEIEEIALQCHDQTEKTTELQAKNEQLMFLNEQLKEKNVLLQKEIEEIREKEFLLQQMVWNQKRKQAFEIKQQPISTSTSTSTSTPSPSPPYTNTNTILSNRHKKKKTMEEPKEAMENMQKIIQSMGLSSTNKTSSMMNHPMSTSTSTSTSTCTMIKQDPLDPSLRQLVEENWKKKEFLSDSPVLLIPSKVYQERMQVSCLGLDTKDHGEDDTGRIKQKFTSIDTRLLSSMTIRPSTTVVRRTASIPNTLYPAKNTGIHDKPTSIQL